MKKLLSCFLALSLFFLSTSGASAYSFFNYSVQDMHDAWNVYAHQLRYVFYIKCYSEQFFGGSSSVRTWTIPLNQQTLRMYEGANFDGNDARQCISFKIIGLGIDGSSVTNMTFKTSGSYIFQAGASLAFQYNGEVYNPVYTENWGTNHETVQTVDLGNKPIILTNTNGFTRPGDVSRWLRAGFPSQFNFKPVAMNFEKTADSPTYHEYTSGGYIIWHNTDTYNLDFAGYGENAYNNSLFTPNRVSVWAGDIYDHGQSLLDVQSGQGWVLQLGKSPLTFMPVTALQDQVEHQLLQQIDQHIQNLDNTQVVNRINDLRAEEQRRYEAGQQAENQRLETVMNDNTASSEGQLANFMTSFDDGSDPTLVSIVTKPLAFVQSMVNSACSPLVLPLPFVNSNLTLPCGRAYISQFAAPLISLWDIISVGLISYSISIDLFTRIRKMKNPDDSSGGLSPVDL